MYDPYCSQPLGGDCIFLLVVVAVPFSTLTTAYTRSLWKTLKRTQHILEILFNPAGT